MPENQKRLLEAILSRFLSFDRLAGIITEGEDHHPGDPKLARIAESIRSIVRSTVNLNAKGPFTALADAVCALYGRALMGEEEARQAWGVLEICFRPEGSRTPLACMGRDVTAEMRKAVRKRIDLSQLTAANASRPGATKREGDLEPSD